MATADQVTFRLERFGWSMPDRLELMGRWYGLDQASTDAPVLVAFTGEDEHRLEPLPSSVRFERDGRWSASFPWELDAAALSSVELDMGNGLSLELPPPSRNVRRFGRPLLQARFAGAAPQQPRADAEPAPVPPEDASPLDLHTALIQALEDVEEARADAAHAREEALLARRDAERERDRRQGESSRMREALATARSLAEEQVAAEHEQSMELRSELEKVNNRLAAERLNRSGLREEIDALRADLELVSERERTQVERLGAELAAAREQVAAGAEEARRRAEELERLRARMLEGERMAKEAERMREELEATRQRAAEVEPLQAALAESQARVAEIEPLRAALDEARRRAAEVEPLEAELQEAHVAVRDSRVALQDLTGRYESLRERLEAARQALGPPDG